MEFTVSRADLVRELSLSQGVVEKKTTIPILSNVLIEAVGERIVLTATDLELGIRCSCPARVKKEGSGTVPARKLLDFVRLLPEGDVNMKFLENHWASITAGKARTRIAGMSRESFPELPQMPAKIAELPVKVLATMISRTQFAISTEGVAVYAERRSPADGSWNADHGGGDGWTSAGVCTDQGRVHSQVETNFRALVPKKAMAELVKLADLADGENALAGFGGATIIIFSFEVGHRSC